MKTFRNEILNLLKVVVNKCGIFRDKFLTEVWDVISCNAKVQKGVEVKL